MTKILEIYLNNGGFVVLEDTIANREQLFGAIDQKIDWVTIGNTTLNVKQITYFEFTAQEAQGGIEK